jgi:transcriptional regulator with XRE-family HTH domain
MVSKASDVRSPGVDYSAALRSLMTQANISSYRSLSQASGSSRSAIDALRRGQVGQLRLATLQRLSQALGAPLDTLIHQFGPAAEGTPAPDSTDPVEALRQECDRLQTQLATQAETVRQQVQQEAIAQLESWLVQWPTAAHAATQRDDLPAHRLLPLVRPIEGLIERWGVVPIETVGAEVPFDPQIHQPKSGCIAPGQPVRVSHLGYRQGDRLLHRARVVPIDL